MTDDELVRAGTRRVVGRAALRRLGALVREWQAEEAAKAVLAKRFSAGLAVAALLALALFHWLYR
ncbi:hypothetical protein [Azospira restricta]|uniref:Uncharacterized protein n=1 Tax=Azospira restricta TaxID=404405 RepID=A0A974PXX4_9RHOO|nr:hypothetical protein [Azospira restricta]QRJ63524.1 hypothetical protein IWH25_17570 [Azospira restricta]